MASSIAQASASALAGWLKASLTPDITVLDRWPTGESMPVNADGRVRVVSVTKVGSRRRLDAELPLVPLSATATGPGMARVTLPIGGFMQPLQIDVWCGFDNDRDDIIDQLDTVLNVGVDQTISDELFDDPVKDGIVLPLREENGYTGFIDCWFDEPTLEDDPTAIAGAEFQGRYEGEARGTFARICDVPLIQSATVTFGLTTVTLTQTPDGITITEG